MGATILFKNNLREDLAEHLSSSTTEEVAFLLANASGETFTAHSLFIVPESGFEYKGALHVSLKDHVRQYVIQWAWKHEASLIEAHSHIRGPAEFSPTDWEGLQQFVPHVWWRLSERPYLSLVFSPEDFDGLYWSVSPTNPDVVDALVSRTRSKEYATHLSRRQGDLHRDD